MFIDRKIQEHDRRNVVIFHDECRYSGSESLLALNILTARKYYGQNGLQRYLTSNRKLSVIAVSCLLQLVSDLYQPISCRLYILLYLDISCLVSCIVSCMFLASHIHLASRIYLVSFMYVAYVCSSYISRLTLRLYYTFSIFPTSRILHLIDHWHTYTILYLCRASIFIELCNMPDCTTRPSSHTFKKEKICLEKALGLSRYK